jgi:thymidylate synthase
MLNFKNAEEAFIYLYNEINTKGQIKGNTKFIPNIGFNILNPLDNYINSKDRNWKSSYAQLEWDWYLSGDRSVTEIKKFAKIWDKMHNGDDLVNSNYGYQWNRNNQLENIINDLKNDPNSRRAFITIHDGKESELYTKDTPCTLSIGFAIYENKLNMNVLMRSNDLWFGFCNDQYCFSKLQEMVATKLNIEVGVYYHYATDMHLYEQHLNKKI